MFGKCQSRQSTCKEILVLDNGHLVVQGSEKKRSSGEENSPQGAWVHIAERSAVGIRRKRTSYLPCNDSFVQVYAQKAKDMEKLSLHFTSDYPTIETIFRIIVSANELSLYGNSCEHM